MSDSEFPSWAVSARVWKTCTFEGLATKKQAYLDLLTEEMARKGFQKVKKVEMRQQIDSPWDRLLVKFSNLIFDSPDGKLKIAIRALPKNGDLRVGFTDSTSVTRKQFFIILAC